MRENGEWFEKFYSKSFSNVTYTGACDASQYINFLQKCTHFKDYQTQEAVDRARWPELKIFDQCCGDGSVSAAMASQLRSRVLGVDLSKRAIKDARKRFASVSGLQFKVADAREFYIDDAFDVVTCWHFSCSYSKDDATNMKQLECMSKSLKRDGLLVLESMNPNFIRKNFVEKRARILDDGTIVGTWYKLSGKMLSSTWKTCSKNNVIETFTGMTKLYSCDEYCAMLAAVGVEVIASFGSLRCDILSDEFGRMILVGIKKSDDESNSQV